MDKGKPTLGIYGIPDRNDLPFPEESHDHGIVLMNKGKVEKFLQLERQSRIKHDHHLPNEIFNLLKSDGLLPGDYDIAFSNNVLGCSLVSKNGKLRLEGSFQEPLATEPVKAHSFWLDKSREAWMVSHELAHVFSAMPFYGNFPENSLLIHFDGGGSQSNFSAWMFKNNNLTLLEAHWELKYLSAFFNANALCFGIIGAKKEEQLSVPGKMMGLASYGNYNPKMESWLKANAWFYNIWSSKQEFFDSARESFGWEGRKLSSGDKFLQDIVATLQTIFIRDTRSKVESLSHKYKLDNLVFTGGCALNIVLNASLVRSGIFDNILIPPCTNDSGLALGTAACLEYKKHGEMHVHNPYLENWEINGEPAILDTFSPEDIAITARWIFDGEIIGVCNGFGEAGPRALGNRSLLCRADDSLLAKKLSTEIKGREWYRPLAPIMRKNHVQKYTGETDPSALGLFMLDEFKILPAQYLSICGAVHIDGTARIQFLDRRSQNPFIWDLLIYLEDKYGIDCLVNTSFNQRGEPIVDSALDAKNAAVEMGLKGLVLQGKAIRVSDFINV